MCELMFVFLVMVLKQSDQQYCQHLLWIWSGPKSRKYDDKVSINPLSEEQRVLTTSN